MAIYHKFHAKRVELDGIKFPSKREAGYYLELKLRISAGEVVFFLRQVPFDLPGNVRYRADFLIFESNGVVRCVDVKGYDTPMSKLKRKQVEALYPGVSIELT